MSKLKTIFMGTPDFAVPCLEVLQAKTEVLAVITQPDRPRVEVIICRHLL